MSPTPRTLVQAVTLSASAPTIPARLQRLRRGIGFIELA
jgi:hypothetical protein